ncbi:MAG TPA: aminodeoxychorismate/anthranilate synthase component II [Phycisphaerales bacterium]|nr:aminodeoxychorismate/anthranilate synthase component II [Phycisphaerales bacterium]
MILLIDNYDSFTWNLVQRLGELEPTLKLGESLVVARNDKITPDEAAALDHGRGPSRVIISPGPCTPREAGVSPAIIARFAGRVPVLGVCLGHQCMGDMHGMTVARHTIQVHGKTSPIYHDGDGIFRGLSNPFTATRYHSLVVLADTVPPPPRTGEGGWVVSAWTDDPVASAAGRAADPSNTGGQAASGTTQRCGTTERVVMGLRRVWSATEEGSAPVEGVQFHPESFLTDEGPRLLRNFLDM